MGDFSPYTPVFGPGIAPRRRPDPLLHRISGAGTGAPQHVAILAAWEWALARGAIRLRLRSPADLSHGVGQLGVECGQRGACAQRQLQVARFMGGELECRPGDMITACRRETSASSVRVAGGEMRCRSSMSLASLATRRQIAAGGRSHHPHPPPRPCQEARARWAEGTSNRPGHREDSRPGSGLGRLVIGCA
jgi:hypothetical protein